MTSKIEKYVIHGVRVPATEDCPAHTVWAARVPWGTYESFDSWKEAADHLRLRYVLRQKEK